MQVTCNTLLFESQVLEVGASIQMNDLKLKMKIAQNHIQKVRSALFSLLSDV
jgi:hypothetical protein